MRKVSRDYYDNLDLGEVNDSKKFWNTVKPVSGNKITVLRQLPPRKISLQPQKLNLTPTLTLTKEQFCSGEIIWLPPNSKTNPNFDWNANPNRRDEQFS